MRCKTKPSWCCDMTTNGSKLEKEPDFPRRTSKRSQVYPHVLFMTQVQLTELPASGNVFFLNERIMDTSLNTHILKNIAY